MRDIIKKHLINKYYSKGMRLDGRKMDEYRKIEVEYSVSAKSAEGSARVKIGDTEVVAGVKVELGTPYADRPDQGSIIVNAELSPLASDDFETGPPSIDSIEMSRVIDRVLRESGAVNFKKLCVKKGEQVWLVLVDIYPINNDGNLFDAGYLAAVAALNNAKFPKVVDGQVMYGDLTTKKIPLDLIPTSTTVIKVGDYFVIDPTREEQKATDARLTVGILPSGELCALQKGGDVALSEQEVLNMVDLAIKKSKELKKLVK